ncbi:MAG: 16S rRNA (adenine(1518)-N(6)/adenine(1519)-N(6))-dimethyltransferase RsmA [Candidatus Pacebacteria bacterium]|nr:16S rRNA (adenine(1518)-N(6)/adenine(1519)-N(6))-dimethyltransferase RsmA [Candidatus Paceibacterota bacterium]
MIDLLKTTRHLCSVYNLEPKKKHGQNFLISETAYEHILKAANLNSKDIVLEVGPGLGFLTAKLSELVKKVISVEIDSSLAEVLETATKSLKNNNIEIVRGNILDFTETDLSKGYKVVANLPYNITSIFLRKFLSSSNSPQSLTLMLQKEVVERILASAGSHSLLSLSVQYYSQPQLITYVPKESFWPQPEVDSAVIYIEVKNKKQLPFKEKEEKLFFRLLKFGFSAKRKKLKNNLAGALRLETEIIVKELKTLGITDSVRAQELSLEDWLKLFARLKPYML